MTILRIILLFYLLLIRLWMIYNNNLLISFGNIVKRLFLFLVWLNCLNILKRHILNFLIVIERNYILRNLKFIIKILFIRLGSNLLVILHLLLINIWLMNSIHLLHHLHCAIIMASWNYITFALDLIYLVLLKNFQWNLFLLWISDLILFLKFNIIFLRLFIIKRLLNIL